MGPRNKLSLQAAIDDLPLDETVRHEIEFEAQVLIAASDLLVELDRRRELKGLTKAELARTAGLKPSNVRKMLSSATGRLELPTLIRLTNALGATLRLQLSGGTELSETRG